ncbi:hypothetical protein [Sphingobium sp. ZW T5_29]|uniref:hypothetical protein n=1 Tax=Sphingobium sp. ZW T5_29 TaxID=3378077 RepID=UPI00385338C0
MREVVVATVTGPQVGARRRERLGSGLADGMAIIRGAEMARRLARESAVRVLGKSVTPGEGSNMTGAEFFVAGGLDIA